MQASKACMCGGLQVNGVNVSNVTGTVITWSSENRRGLVNYLHFGLVMFIYSPVCFKAANLVLKGY